MDNKFKLFIVLNSALFAALGNITAANATASRLVYSMARDGHLPKLFARVSGKNKVPMNAMVLISALALAIGIFGVSQASLLTTLVTFGALLSYILMHFSVITPFFKRNKSRQWFTHLVSPLLGAAILIVALWDADTNAKIVGIIWLVIGVGVATYLRLSGRDLKNYCRCLSHANWAGRSALGYCGRAFASRSARGRSRPHPQRSGHPRSDP